VEEGKKIIVLIIQIRQQ